MAGGSVPVPQNHKCQTCANIAQWVALHITEVGRCVSSVWCWNLDLMRACAMHVIPLFHILIVLRR